MEEDNNNNNSNNNISNNVKSGASSAVNEDANVSFRVYLYRFYKKLIERGAGAEEDD